MTTLSRALSINNFQYSLPNLYYDCSSLEPVLSTTMISYQYKKILKVQFIIIKNHVDCLNKVMIDLKSSKGNDLQRHNECFDYHYGAYTNILLFLDNL